MKHVLLDHCVPKPLGRLLAGFNIRTCHEEGWDRLRNGELLEAAEAAAFDVFITADQNLRYQQNLQARQIAIVELSTNRLAMMGKLSPAIQRAVENAAPGSYTQIPLE